jgi:hypothetical protein
MSVYSPLETQNLGEVHANFSGIKQNWDFVISERALWARCNM